MANPAAPKAEEWVDPLPRPWEPGRGQHVGERISITGAVRGPEVDVNMIEIHTLDNSSAQQLIRTLAKSDPPRYKEAEFIVTEMARGTILPDATTYGMLVGIQVEGGQLRNAIHTYEYMITNGIVPGRDTFNSIIRACSKAGRVDQTIKIFEDMAGHDVAPSTTTYNILIGACAKGGSAQEAVSYFDEMRAAGVEPDVVTYNVLLSAYLAMGDSHGVLSHFGEMREMGLRPILLTYHIALEACATAGLASEAMATIRLMDEAGAALDLGMYSHVMAALDGAGAGRGGEAVEVFNHMATAGVWPDLDVYRRLISLCCQSGMWEQGLAAYDDATMGGFALPPDSQRQVLFACERAGHHAGVAQLYRAMRGGGEAPGGEGCTAVLRSCARAGDWELAQEVRGDLSGGGEAPTVEWYNHFLALCRKEKKWDEVARLMVEMGQQHLTPDVDTLDALLECHADAGTWERSRAAWNALTGTSVVPRLASYRVYLRALAAGGQAELAVEAFNSATQERGLRPDTATYNALMAAYHAVGRGEHVTKAFADMWRWGCKPDVETYNIVMEAEAKGGRPEGAARAFEEMQRNGLVPTTHTYNILLAPLCEKGACEQAKGAMRAMAATGAAPDLSTFDLLASCFYCGEQWEDVIKAFDSCRADLFQAMNLHHGPPGQGLAPQTPRHHSAAVDAFEKLGDDTRAMQIFRGMQEQGIRPDDVACSAYVSMARRQGKWAELVDAVNGLRKRHVILSQAVAESEMVALCKLGKDGAVMAAFGELKRRRMGEPTRPMWDSLVVSASRAGHHGKCVRAYPQAKAAAAKVPPHIVAHPVVAAALTSFIELGRHKEAAEEFQSIEAAAGREPDAELYHIYMLACRGACDWLHLLTGFNRRLERGLAIPAPDFDFLFEALERLEQWGQAITAWGRMEKDHGAGKGTMLMHKVYLEAYKQGGRRVSREGNPAEVAAAYEKMQAFTEALDEAGRDQIARACDRLSIWPRVVEAHEALVAAGADAEAAACDAFIMAVGFRAPGGPGVEAKGQAHDVPGILEAIIYALSRREEWSSAVCAFDQLLAARARPQHQATCLAVVALENLGDFERAAKVLDMLPRAQDASPEAASAGVSSLAHTGQWERAADLFESMRARGLEAFATGPAFEGFVCACEQLGQAERAVGAFIWMEALGHTPTARGWAALLRAHVAAGQGAWAEQRATEALARGIPADDDILAATMSALVSNDHAELAIVAFEDQKRAGAAPGLAPHSALFRALGVLGRSTDILLFLLGCAEEALVGDVMFWAAAIDGMWNSEDERAVACSLLVYRVALQRGHFEALVPRPGMQAPREEVLDLAALPAGAACAAIAHFLLIDLPGRPLARKLQPAGLTVFAGESPAGHPAGEGASPRGLLEGLELPFVGCGRASPEKHTVDHLAIKFQPQSSAASPVVVTPAPSADAPVRPRDLRAKPSYQGSIISDVLSCQASDLASVYSGGSSTGWTAPESGSELDRGISDHSPLASPARSAPINVLEIPSVREEARPRAGLPLREVTATKLIDGQLVTSPPREAGPQGGAGGQALRGFSFSLGSPAGSPEDHGSGAGSPGARSGVAAAATAAGAVAEDNAAVAATATLARPVELPSIASSGVAETPRHVRVGGSRLGSLPAALVPFKDAEMGMWCEGGKLLGALLQAASPMAQRLKSAVRSLQDILEHDLPPPPGASPGLAAWQGLAPLLALARAPPSAVSPGTRLAPATVPDEHPPLELPPPSPHEAWVARKFSPTAHVNAKVRMKLKFSPQSQAVSQAEVEDVRSFLGTKSLESPLDAPPTLKASPPAPPAPSQAEVAAGPSPATASPRGQIAPPSPAPPPPFSFSRVRPPMPSPGAARSSSPKPAWGLRGPGPESPAAERLARAKEYKAPRPSPRKTSPSLGPKPRWGARGPGLEPMPKARVSAAQAKARGAAARPAGSDAKEEKRDLRLENGSTGERGAAPMEEAGGVGAESVGGWVGEEAEAKGRDDCRFFALR